LQWEKKRVLLTVKAYPEPSKKYGSSVCLAGITDSGEFIRLFPVPFDLFRSRKIPKYSWIEVECTRVNDYTGRKESHKVRRDAPNCGITVVDDSLVRTEGGRTPWIERSRKVMPLRSESIEELQRKFGEDRTSLGIVKVNSLLDFHYRKPLDEFERDVEEGRSTQIQRNLYGIDRSLLEVIPHNFYYRFKCCQDCPEHDMSFEDWELFESFRSWRRNYKDNDVLWTKLREKYLDWFRARDLHFFVGTHSRWGNWMIVGAYYPPK
jgi:hypothetical protein